MKNLKSLEAHVELFKKLVLGKARVVTYGLSHCNYFSTPKMCTINSLSIPNIPISQSPNLSLSFRKVLPLDAIVGNFDSNENNVGAYVFGIKTLCLNDLEKFQKQGTPICIAAVNPRKEIAEKLDCLGLDYYCFYEQNLFEKIICRVKESFICVDRVDIDVFLEAIIPDVFGVYLGFEDCYRESLINPLFEIFPDGPYGLVNDDVNVTVESGDVVIDAGAYVGDFAAYASAKGAVTYAFEPTKNTFETLRQTASLNRNVFPVNSGLGQKKEKLNLVVHDMISEGNHFSAQNLPNSVQAQVTTIDDFVMEHDLQKVDFIKADIEGFERYMLLGAKETLRKFAPKLAICTYHKPDDPQVLERIIKESNPNYKVVQKQSKLFASV